jgi:multiple sugar transport system substrate-binding protein/putative aldouronate transport system substrate-binding protein
MVDFIDWLYSPEGIMFSSAQTSGTCGPEGLTWEMKDGRPVLTEFGVRAFSGDEQLTMPEGWGSGTYKDGISQLNYKAVATTDINPVNNAPYTIPCGPLLSNPTAHLWTLLAEAHGCAYNTGIPREAQWIRCCSRQWLYS